MKLAFDAVCWDHDGLLVDTEQLFFTSTREVFAESGVLLTEQLWSVEYLSKGGTTASIASTLGLDRSAEKLIAERNRRYKELLRACPPLRPGVIETLQSLFGSVPMALVTGSNREDIDTVHQGTGMLGLFTAIIARADYAAAKPAPDAYIAAAKQLGVAPERSLAVEDSERGMIAALAAGMKCVVVPNNLTRLFEFAGAHAIEESVITVPRYLGLQMKASKASQPTPLAVTPPAGAPGAPTCERGCL
jgi:HAD superfamily hydrolase (TIGR01509 family)